MIMSAEELKKLDRTSVLIEEEGHLVGLNVFHHLHCLVG